MARRERSTRCVLIVDDNFSVRELMTDILETAGFRVLSAGNGREALALLRGGEPVGLILLDLEMPVMNGWEFRAEQRRHPRLRRIPVVVVSGDDDSWARAAGMHVDGCLRKPVPLRLLLNTVRSYLPRHASPAPQP